ncbi:MAG: flagellar basal-body MS-ring/collar protein FliF, partial [Rickettsiales bacterium]
MNGLAQMFKEMSPTKIAMLAGTAVLMLGFFIFLSTRLSTPNMTPLYSGLSVEDSAQIVEELEKTNVPYEIQAAGTMILVPSEQVQRLRIAMAGEGLPSSGNIVGYEIFDQSDKLGTSSFVHNVNLLRATEGELARTIGELAGVEKARVHLVMPKRELFSREKQKPSASVALTMRGSSKLSKQEIESIRHLVASAVPELDPTQITVVDNKGRLLARGGEDDDGFGVYASMAAEYRVAFERRMRDTVERMLEKTLGNGKVRAEVTADIDFDRVVTNSETFDPEGQVARSVQNTEE